MQQEPEDLARVQCDWAETEPTTAIVTAIAEFENVHQSALGLTLYDHINPDAVDNLFPAKSGQPVELDLHIDEYQVHVDNSGVEVSTVRNC